MADKSYNVSVGQKNIYNVYNDLGSNLTGLVPFQVGANVYLFKSAETNRLGTIFNPNLFNTPFSDMVNIIDPSNYSAQTFYFDGLNWVYGFDFITDANDYVIPENYLIQLQTQNIFLVPVGGGAVIKRHDCYYLNGTQASGLYFEKGKTYQFVQTGISNSGNPLNIYVDEYGNKKLEKYVSISGTAGVDRYITVSIPKSYKETSTLYYGNESGEFFGAPIKLISTDYYLKHNIKLICFDVKHDGTKYIIPDRLLDQKFINYNGENNYFALTSGILGIISTPDGNNIASSSLTTRKDTLFVNLVQKNGGLFSANFNINYFGNILTYKKNNATGSNEWSNLSDLYWLLNDKTFADSGRMDDFSPEDKQYKQYGYQLSGCEGCIKKIILTTGQRNAYSGTFELYYNPIELTEDYTANLFLNTTTGNIKTEDFISFDNIGAVTYSKSFYNDTNYSIPRKI